MDLVEFLTARLDEDEAEAHLSKYDETWWLDGPFDPDRVLREVAARRAILAWHEAWPVLVESAPELTQDAGDDPHAMVLRMSRQIAWATQQEYRNRFGDDPPTGPILRYLAAVYSDHPDYLDEWRPSVAVA